MKKLIILIILITLFIIPSVVSANIMCNDGTESPSCTFCHQGCCSKHKGCAANNYQYNDEYEGDEYEDDEYEDDEYEDDEVPEDIKIFSIMLLSGMGGVGLYKAIKGN